MMNSHEHPDNEQRWEQLFAALRNDVPPADGAWLDALRERSTVVFEKQSRESARLPKRRRKMIVLATRMLAVAATAAVLFVSWFLGQPESPDGPELRVVLAQLAQAESLHVQLTRDGQTTNVYARKPHQMRWNLPQGGYRIDDGTHLWDVDEQANRAVPRESLRAQDAGTGLDVLGLLDEPAREHQEQLLEQRPVARQMSNGVLCDVYRWKTRQDDTAWQLEAWVAADDATLRSLETSVMREGRLQPVCRLVVAAVNPPLDEQLFRIADTLTVDGRIGKVLDLQGLVAIQPLTHSRWTPLSPGVILKPGDMLRCDKRGANAVLAQLVPRTRITFGPGTVVELMSPSRIRLSAGELKIVSDPGEPLTIVGPGDQQLAAAGTQCIRLVNEQLVKLQDEPAWTAGFEGATTKESVGSLVAKIDGRDVPLTVGYHKVSVAIRDQIARTVIEESFVNHTREQLEGVFYFPLPQDASISGFGMWIGDELVEADIVEKQRAREIYETILREKRDPGLLEWTGGNLFKARVFPIPARSEKRIKIAYTQVLPLQGDSYRYAYALQSELLRQHPLNELAINVNISSEQPLTRVESPTHSARISHTEHSARVEFTAQEYTPDRDFEVVVGVQRRPASAVLIPHRRGDDGYFMLQLTPPGALDLDDRAVLPDGAPLEILILADTSASMLEDTRHMQDAMMTALLSSLSAADRFNLVMCDVECHWLFDEPVPADPRNVDVARATLEKRVSLGWTDLEQAFAEVLKRTGGRTHVVYLGDGVPTSGDADPIALNKRLRQLYEGHQATVHAVALGSSYEPLVLKAMASLGGGSYRQVTDPQSVRKAARELLSEITQPVTRFTGIEFQGLRAARVYPRELPNLPAGTQQIVLGRFLPEAKDVEGEILVQALRDDEPLTMTVPFRISSGEEGNSFIPRLWARMHLDALLEQGSSQAIQDEVIALSEQYHIITPYTSLLVLESDEDRERFQVQRRFQMRDGERFFAEGRENVNYELLQQQMRQAGEWRIRLRMQALRELATLGREPGGLQRERYAWNRRAGVAGPWGGDMSGHWYFNGDVTSLAFSPDGSMMAGSMAPYAMPTGGRLGYDAFEFLDGDARSSGMDFFADAKGLAGGFGLESLEVRQELSQLSLNGPLPVDALFSLGDEMAAPMDGVRSRMLMSERSKRDFSGPWGGPEYDYLGTSVYDSTIRLWDAEPAYGYGGRGLGGGLSGGFGSFGGGFAGGYASDFGAVALSELSLARSGPGRPPESRWLDTLFPALPAPPREIKDAETPSAWPDEARSLAQSLLRQGLQHVNSPLEIVRTVRYYETRWQEQTSQRTTTSLLNPGSWLVVTEGDGAQTLVQTCDEHERSVFSRALLLGRARAAKPEDIRQPPLELDGYVLTSLESSYRDYEVELTAEDDSRVLLTLKHPSNTEYQLEYLIDTQRNVLLQVQNRQAGKVTSTQKFSEFVQVAGDWIATQIETFDDRQRRSVLITLSFSELDETAVIVRGNALREGSDRVQWIHQPLPRLRDAQKAVRDGAARFEDHLIVLLKYERIQRWQRVLQQLEAMESLAQGKPGMVWLRDALLNAARQRETLRGRILDRARSLVDPGSSYPANERYFLATHLLGQAHGVLEANEMLDLLDLLKPIYEQQPPYWRAMKQWHQQRVSQLQNVGRGSEARALQEQLARDYPHDAELQQQYAQALVSAREYEAAIQWIASVLTPEAEWYPHEEESLRNVITQLYRSSGLYPELVEYLQAWVATEPENLSAYQQYLTALIKNDQIEQAHALITQWLADAGQLEGWTQRTYVRGQAASQQALGQGYDLNTDRLDERWYDPLADIVLFHLQHEGQSPREAVSLADSIMQNHRFRGTPQAMRVRNEVANVLDQRLAELAFEPMNRMVNWIWNDMPAAAADQWKRIEQEVARRWHQEPRDTQKHAWGQLLGRVLSEKIGTEAYLEFLRKQVDEGPQQRHDEYVQALFNTLLNQPWSQEYEEEAAGLLGDVSTAEDPVQRLGTQVVALYRLSDTMVQARYNALMAEVEDPSKLTRTELREAQTQRLQQARRQYAERLDARKHGVPAELVLWLDAEWIYLQVQLGEQLEQVAERCWEFLGSEPAQLDAGQGAGDVLKSLLLRRYLLTLGNLAARRTAPPELATRLLDYVGPAAQDDGEQAAFWRHFQFQLLIVLDRSEELTKLLESWAEQEDALTDQYRVALGYLLAEQGQLEQAIEQFEGLRADDVLPASELQALSQWYQVLDRREQYEQTLRARFEMTDESQLQRWLSGQLQIVRGDGGRNAYPYGGWSGNPPGSGSPMPGEMDENVPRVFTVLFAKSSQPERYLDLLREFYRNTHEFELLSGVAEAVVGHTAGRVYPFLSGINSVLVEVREEATCDALTAHLQLVRQRATTAVDRRALDLLELMVERRAAEVLNQPGPHSAAALAAMRRAFKEEWTAGEPRPMAEFLAGLGRISERPLAEHQVNGLEILHREGRENTEDRLYMAVFLANAYWNYERYEDAIDLLDTELNQYRGTHDGLLTESANGPLRTFVSYLADRGHFVRAETVLQQQLALPHSAQQQLSLRRQLFELYERALRSDGEVSLGKSVTLYRELVRRLQGDLVQLDNEYRRDLIRRLMSVYRTARDKNIVSAPVDLVAFARDQLPAVLRHQVNEHHALVGEVAEAIKELAGAREALAMLVRSLANEPRWFNYVRDDGWNRHCWQLARWREEVKELGDLEEPLLAVVTGELRRDLESRESRNRVMYWQNTSYFWSEQVPAFVRTAETVYAQKKHSGEAVRYVAEYLANGLDKYARAIEMLWQAQRDGVLGTDGAWQLAEYLHHEQQFEESIPLLEPLVKENPEQLAYRTKLMHAYFRSDRPRLLRELLAATDAYFHQGNRWTENVISQLAASCLENQLFEQAVDYYDEVIALHKRTQPNRGIGNGTLSSYCQSLAYAYAGWDKTSEAVDAACEAIVSWGPRQEQRAGALQVLEQILRDAADLESYVQQLDHDGEISGQDKPVVRKTLGVVYFQKQQYAAAVRQLQQALALQPQDAAIHEKLIECFDKFGDRRAAIQQSLALLQLKPRDIEIYKQLGRRYDSMGSPDEVERTYTSIVEALPHEAEGHAMLAQIREEQERWEEAARHWQQVAALRSLEPTGLLKLAAAQIRLQRWTEAKQTLARLRTRSWPQTFGDVDAQARQLEGQLEGR